MNGFATITKNVFSGKRPHELTVCITTGLLGDIRRFAVSSVADAKIKCEQLGVVLK